MSERVGILLDKRTLAQAVRGGETLERVHLYKSAARRMGIPIVLFSLGDVDMARKRVNGYVPTAHGFRRVRTTLPRVVHKRTLYRDGSSRGKLRKLEQRGVIVTNPSSMSDKKRMYQLLSHNPQVRSHIPQTVVFSWDAVKSELKRGHALILKPRIGSVGDGIVKLTPLPGGQVRVSGRKAYRVSLGHLPARLAQRLRGRHYLVQRYVQLARYHGRPFDLRVPVQRDRRGAWQVVGMVAKVAGRHPFLTNLAKGGRAVLADLALRDALATPHIPRVKKQISTLALRVAKAVARRYSRAADLGLDIGVDRKGHPWLFEVNARDQRYSFLKAGDIRGFRRLYTNPIAYCGHVLRSLRSR